MANHPNRTKVSPEIAAAMGRARRLGCTRGVLDSIRTAEPTTMTYAEVIAEIVERDVKKWGESERAASASLNRRNSPTLGLALNRLAYHDIDAFDERLSAQAIIAMTDADVHALRQGG